MIKIFDMSEVDSDKILARKENKTDVCATVSEIIANVRANGDAALCGYAKRFDRAELDSLLVTKDEIARAKEEVGEDFLSVLREAAANIAKFHTLQKRTGFILNEDRGIVEGQKIVPLDSVGIYVPGGTAAYPSTVLMNAIPARIAGVSRIVMVTPATGGRIAPEILAAADIAGVSMIFKCGGAQAVAALAYGTESIPAVNKIVGPGNAYVAEAKKQVFGRVGIDMIAGPSEILVVADGGCDPELVAADMLSQAEHDKNACAVLVTDSRELASAVSAELEAQIPALQRSEIARASIDENGKIIIAPSIERAIEVSNEIAPEHLEICVENPFDYLDLVKNAGSVFLGRNCPEALGDYFAGPNHTLPTSGTAKFSSPLSVDDFVKKIQYTYFTRSALETVSDKIDKFARREGLEAHALSVTKRTKGGIK